MCLLILAFTFAKHWIVLQSANKDEAQDLAMAWQPTQVTWSLDKPQARWNPPWGPTELVGTSSIVFYGLKVIKMKTLGDWLERLFQPQAFTQLCGMSKPLVLAAPLPIGRAKPMKKEQPWTRTARTRPWSGCSRASMTWDMVAFSMAREQDTSSIWAALPISRKGLLSSCMFQVTTGSISQH